MSDTTSSDEDMIVEVDASNDVNEADDATDDEDDAALIQHAKLQPQQQPKQAQQLDPSAILANMKHQQSSKDDDSENTEDENEDNENDDDDTGSTSELDSWKQVHAQLVHALSIAREAVAAKKLQRRLWLEEICANLTEEGKLTPTSVWTRPTLYKKPGASKRKPAVGGVVAPKKKRVVKPEGGTADKPKKKPGRKKKTAEGEDGPDPDGEKKKKIRLSLKAKKEGKTAPSKSPSPIPPGEERHDQYGYQPQHSYGNAEDEETSEEDEQQEVAEGDDDSEDEGYVGGSAMDEYRRRDAATAAAATAAMASRRPPADYSHAVPWGGAHHSGYLVRIYDLVAFLWLCVRPIETSHMSITGEFRVFLFRGVPTVVVMNLIIRPIPNHHHLILMHITMLEGYSIQVIRRQQQEQQLRRRRHLRRLRLQQQLWQPHPVPHRLFLGLALVQNMKVQKKVMRFKNEYGQSYVKRGLYMSQAFLNRIFE